MFLMVLTLKLSFSWGICDMQSRQLWTLPLLLKLCKQCA